MVENAQLMVGEGRDLISTIYCEICANYAGKRPNEGRSEMIYMHKKCTIICICTIRMENISE